MHKKILGLILAGVISFGAGMVTSFANEKEQVQTISLKSQLQQAKITNGWVKNNDYYWSYYKNGAMLKE